MLLRERDGVLCQSDGTSEKAVPTAASARCYNAHALPKNNTHEYTKQHNPICTLLILPPLALPCLSSIKERVRLYPVCDTTTTRFSETNSPAPLNLLDFAKHLFGP